MADHPRHIRDLRCKTFGSTSIDDRPTTRRESKISELERRLPTTPRQLLLEVSQHGADLIHVVLDIAHVSPQLDLQTSPAAARNLAPGKSELMKEEILQRKRQERLNAFSAFGSEERGTKTWWR